ncbi:MAG: glycosyltransferase family 2 protein [Gemmataceae bacterium]|nr:glycosyltransferase family 2 protein [Gemmataceae bacterium]
MRVSVVTTMYRSAPYLEEFHRRASEAAARLGVEAEFVYVNDGSPDDALAVALRLRERDGRVRVVDLSRNFGHHPAMMAGLEHATGERVFLIDCDLEEAPELLEAFWAKLDETGADVAHGVQRERQGGLASRLLGWAYYKTVDLLSTEALPRNLMTVRLMTRRYVDALLSHPETEFIIAGLWSRTGFEQVPVEVDKRQKGSTTYTLARKLSHLANTITAFSSKPLYLIFWLGLAVSLVSAALAGFFVVRRLFFVEMPVGWPLLAVSLWLLGGLIMLSQGVLGIYLAKVYSEVKRRPRTIVRAVHQPTGGAHERQRRAA